MSYLFGSWLFINLFWVNGYDITIYEAYLTPVWISGPMMWLVCWVDILESVPHPGMENWAYDVKSTLTRSLINLFHVDWYVMYYHLSQTRYQFQQWMSWFLHWWRTQQNVIRNANRKTSWIIKLLNAHCGNRICLEPYIVECFSIPLGVAVFCTV